MEALRVRTPSELVQHEALLRAMFLHFGMDPDAGIREFILRIRDPLWGLFIVPGQAVGAVQLPHSVLEPMPVAEVIFVSGPKQATRALLKAGRDWLLGLGHTTLRTVNRTGHSDRVHARAMGYKTSTPLGTFLEFKL